MSTELGQAAEQRAAEYLEGLGLKIVERNYRSRWAEIDIIAREKSVFHFVEVKYRRSAVAGQGFEYITADKQRRLINAASAWMVQHHPHEAFVIDVISLDGDQLTYLQNAVQA